MHVWDESRQALLISQIMNGELSLEAACKAHALPAEAVRNWAPVFRHRTLQALDEKLQQASLIASVNGERLGSAAYTGGLDDISVPDLLQTCQMGNKNAVITITRGNERSSIWCESGVVVDAESGRLRGAPALYRILNLDTGQVSADFRLEPRTRTIDLPCHVLLLEAARHKDELARLLAKLDGPRSIFIPAPGAWAAQTTLAEREVLTLCDGERGVSDVLAASPLSDLDTSTAMVSLVSRAYLLRDGTSRPPPPVAAGPGTEDWGKRSSIYLPMAPAPVAAPRPKQSAPLLVALGLALGTALWVAVELIRGEAPPRIVAAPASGLVVEVSTEPAHAELWLDGVRVGAGRLRHELPRDGKLHQLAVLAPGHMPATLVFADDASRFHVVLDPLSSAASPPAIEVSGDTTTAAYRYPSAEAPAERRAR